METFLNIVIMLLSGVLVGFGVALVWRTYQAEQWNNANQNSTGQLIPNTPQPHPRWKREQAEALFFTKTVPQIAELLEVPTRTVYNWRKTALRRARLEGLAQKQHTASL